MLEKARVEPNCLQTSTLSDAGVGYQQTWRSSVDELLSLDAKGEKTPL